MKQRSISVVGLGYVGLPVAVALAASGFKVLGYDHDGQRISELKNRLDRTLEVSPEQLSHHGLKFTETPSDLLVADFHIVAVPTPINHKNEPDLGPLKSASNMLSKVIKPGDLVIFESTVYPGCTEEICKPILESGSELLSPRDFVIGYSPERINPGDQAHNLNSVVKVVSAQTEEGLDIVASVYGTVVGAGLHRASSIRVAEAAKVIENIQRDVNIALINELSEVFDKLAIDTYEVLDAAKTKWNFLPFEPGLVGGHCIGVDPYYLTFKAISVGVDPKIILAGRETNNHVASRVARKCMDWVEKESRPAPKIAILGATFKENVPDVRNSQIPKLIESLGVITDKITVFDPYAELFGNVVLSSGSETKCVWPIDETVNEFDVVILAVPHRQFVEKGWALIDALTSDKHALIIDVKASLPKQEKRPNFTLKRL